MLHSPGRFFAANEIKTMLAYAVLTYDMKLEDGKEFPEAIHVGFHNIPKPKTRVMFRKRSTS